MTTDLRFLPVKSLNWAVKYNCSPGDNVLEPWKDLAQARFETSKREFGIYYKRFCIRVA